ncbi:MAG: iron-containing alcohol dehydrogenase [Candidatus Humimicrobiaceae bacterium]
MKNFTFFNPTKIIFGKSTEQQVGIETRKYADKVLLHYGGSSIKKYGLYDKVLKSLKDEGIEVFELGGVKPNPRLSLVYEGIKICRENDINFILAVGGGSSIDSAKAISCGVKYPGDVWELYQLREKKFGEILPIGVILTIPAAGSETSDSSVITKEEGMLKRYCGCPDMRPRFSILNPELTFTLPREQTVYGISDILAHLMERYFTQVENVDLTDRLIEGTMKSLIKNAYLVLEDPNNYDVRAEIMWNGTIAHNDLLDTGRIADWGSHDIEHELSAIYDIAHGAGLSIIFPAWMKFVYKHGIKKFTQFASRVWGVDSYFNEEEYMALEGIRLLESFYRDLGLPTRLSEIKITSEKFEEMANKCIDKGLVGNFVKLDSKDIVEIYKLAL